MAQTMRWIAWYPYATPAELRSSGLGAARLTPAQIEEKARLVAGYTRDATWAIDTNTVGVFYHIADCADQDAVAHRAVTGLVGRVKTVQGSLVEARKRRNQVCTPPPGPLTLPGTGMPLWAKIGLGVGAVAVAGIGTYALVGRRRS